VNPRYRPSSILQRFVSVRELRHALKLLIGTKIFHGRLLERVLKKQMRMDGSKGRLSGGAASCFHR
jgi:hypothetical protein